MIFLASFEQQRHQLHYGTNTTIRMVVVWYYHVHNEMIENCHFSAKKVCGQGFADRVGRVTGNAGIFIFGLNAKNFHIYIFLLS